MMAKDIAVQACVAADVVALVCEVYDVLEARHILNCSWSSSEPHCRHGANKVMASTSAVLKAGHFLHL